jgi:SPP1 gp7 family putative phage head morphogenesis protein
LQKILNRTIPTGLGLELTLDEIPLDFVHRMIDTPLGGLRFSERLAKNLGDASSRVKSTLTQGLIQGQTVAEVSRAVRGIVDDSIKNRAETIVRTEYARIANQSHLAFFRDNADKIKALIWVSSLDFKVCVQCARLHGKEFPVETKFHPPVHANCRCVFNTRLKSFRELGLNEEDVPEFARDILDGQEPQIPLDFNDVLKGFSEKQQLDMLGKARFDLFQQGVSVKDMATDKRILSLGEIKNKLN